MTFLRSFTFSWIGVAALVAVLVHAPAVWAAGLKCEGTPCTCSTEIGVGFVQGTLGTGGQRNFEVVVPHSGGGLAAYYRDNAFVPGVAQAIWNGPATYHDGIDLVSGLALIESKLGNLEVVATIGNRLVHYYRDRRTLRWFGPTEIAVGVTGQPGFVQSRVQDNFEVVVPLASGGLRHFWRDSATLAWNPGPVFAAGRTYAAVSLVESRPPPGRAR